MRNSKTEKTGDNIIQGKEKDSEYFSPCAFGSFGGHLGFPDRLGRDDKLPFGEGFLYFLLPAKEFYA